MTTETTSATMTPAEKLASAWAALGKPATTFMARLTRAEYETACAAAGAQVVADKKCLGFAGYEGSIRSGDEHVWRHLAACRGLQLKADQEAALAAEGYGLDAPARRCSRCGSRDGQYTTIAGGSVCDDCA